MATVGGEQTHTTSVIKKTLNPYWNEAFDLYVCARNSELKTTHSLFLRLLFFSGFFSSFILDWYLEELADRSFLFFFRRVNEDSILAIQIFDQKKFKKKDQGFLGVINVRIGDVIDLQMGGDGKSGTFLLIDCIAPYNDTIILLIDLRHCRDAHQGPQKIQRQSCRARKAHHQLVDQPRRRISTNRPPASASAVFYIQRSRAPSCGFADTTSCQFGRRLERVTQQSCFNESPSARSSEWVRPTRRQRAVPRQFELL